MRKLTAVILAALLLCGCSTNSSPVPKDVPEIESAIPADMDLTFMSNTVLLSEMNNMLTNPDEYQDKVIRLAGTFSAMKDLQNDGRIYSCEITDGTGCCPAGTSIQIVFGQEPEKIPVIGDNIIVQGVMNYDRGTYYMTMQLLDAEVWVYD